MGHGLAHKFLKITVVTRAALAAPTPSGTSINVTLGSKATTHNWVSLPVAVECLEYSVMLMYNSLPGFTKPRKETNNAVWLPADFTTKLLLFTQLFICLLLLSYNYSTRVT